jgi:hypothetical protein
MIQDDGGSYHIQPYSFRLDKVNSITQDYRKIPSIEETCLLLMDNEMVTILAKFDEVHNIWVKTMNDQQIVIFTNDN